LSPDTKTTYTSGTIAPIEAVANFLAFSDALTKSTNSIRSNSALV
jgi:hypothetical protein